MTTDDPRNTGWALFQIKPGTTLLKDVSGKTYFEVTFSQQPKDGIGFTLGYTVPNLLKICKVAGPGVTSGSSSSFTANWGSTGSSTIGVVAGSAPGGNCALGPSLPLGTTVTLAENIPPGNSVSAIAAVPAAIVTAGPNLSAGTVTVVIGSGVNEVTYTDQAPTGYLEICKQVTSFPPLGNFTFTVSTDPPIGPLGSGPHVIAGPIVVPAGGCSPAIEVPAGRVSIWETTAAFGMTSCATIPAGRQGTCNLKGRTSIVTVVPGGISTQTVAIITNNSQPIYNH